MNFRDLYFAGDAFTPKLKRCLYTNLEVKVTLVIYRIILAIYARMPECSSHAVLDQTRHKSTLWEATNLQRPSVFFRFK